MVARLFLLLVFGCGGFATPSLAREPLALVPSEHMLVWYGRRLPDTPPAGAGPSPVETVINMIPHAPGVKLDRTGRLALRVLQASGQMVRYRHAIALLDASAVADPNRPQSKQAADLEIGMVVEAKAGPFRRILQTAIDEQTNEEFAKITDQTAHGYAYRELHDTRTPEWVRIAWGEIDDLFVVTLGKDVWPKFAAVAAGEAQGSLDDPWVQQTRTKLHEEALIEILVDADRMKQRLDPELDGWVEAYFAAWDAQHLRRANWAIGMQENRLYCRAGFLLEDETVQRIYADPAPPPADVANLIPPNQRYGVYTLPAGPFVHDLIESLFVWQTPETRQRTRAVWDRIQREHGFDAERDVLSHLGDTFILHSYPRHPLRLPIFFTTLIEIRDEPALVRKTIDTMCTAWSEALELQNERMVVANPAEVRKVGEVWQVNIGALFSVVAWTVTDEYIVVSWSPNALREYLYLVEDELKGVE